MDEWSIHFCGIKESDAALNSGVQKGDHFLLIFVISAPLYSPCAPMPGNVNA